MRKKSLNGEKFGRLTVLGESTEKKGYWFCRCECGKEKTVRRDNLTSGCIKSCGCILREGHTTHGMSRTRIYKIWMGVRGRTQNKNYIWWKNYGGRGIKICDRWQVFDNFRDDMYTSYLEHAEAYGEKNTSIDRIDNDKGYSPENCRWATQKEQSNNSRNCIRIDFEGKNLTLTEWVKEKNLTFNCLYQRLFINDWPKEKALTRPLRVHRKNNRSTILE